MSAPRKDEYDEGFIARLEMMWGEGFLSPGGADEVRAILAGEDLSGKCVLDIGCGAGGAELLLVREFKTKQVVGIDVVPILVERARRLCAEARLSERIAIERVEPGPLPFADSAFNVVFTKDALLHMPDKRAAFREIARVLAPGGLFVGSDWLAGENIATCPHWARFIALRRPSFVMASAGQMAEAMRAARFESITMTDRNEWFVDITARDVEAVTGHLRKSLLGLLGEDGYGDWLAVRRAIAGAAASGSLRPTHLRAIRSD